MNLFGFRFELSVACPKPKSLNHEVEKRMKHDVGTGGGYSGFRVRVQGLGF